MPVSRSMAMAWLHVCAASLCTNLTSAKIRLPFPQRLARSGLRAVVMAPLQVESQVFGVLVAARRRAAQLQQRRVRIPAPAERACGAGRASGAALRRAAAGL